HIALAKEPDLVIIAPATAHLVARAAMGMADDLLTALLLARTGPVLCAPAMNDDMYAHPATQQNLKVLAQRGWQFVGPEIGPLAEGPSDRPGRMSEPEAIHAAAARLLAPPGPLHGKTVVVTAGPTREHLDPVRVLTNPSSGRMGYAFGGRLESRRQRRPCDRSNGTRAAPWSCNEARRDDRGDAARGPGAREGRGRADHERRARRLSSHAARRQEATARERSAHGRAGSDAGHSHL